jgi:hypothetical protein
MPIRVWNGSSWIIGRYWDGSQWRRGNDYQPYVPPTAPVYANVNAQDFNDGTVQGWYGSQYDQAGDPYNSGGTKIRADITQSGLLSALDIYSPEGIQGNKIPVGTAYRMRCSMNIVRRSGTQPSTVRYEVACDDSTTGTVSRPAGNSGWFEVLTPVANTIYAFQTLRMNIKVDCGDLSGNSLYSVEVDWAQVCDANGNILQFESVPGDPGQPEIQAWPKWWDGSQWRG